MSKEEKSQKKKLAKQLAACRTKQGLSKASLEQYLKVCGKQFSKLLSSQQVQAEADRVWCNGPQVHNIAEKNRQRRQHHAQAHAETHEQEQANRQQN